MFCLQQKSYSTVIHCVSKKRANLFFSSMLVKYEKISIKIGRHVLEETLNITMQKVSTSLRICIDGTIYHFKFPTYFRTNWHSMNSFVNCLFQNMHTNFCWNRFMLDRHRAINKFAGDYLARFFETQCRIFVYMF